MLAPHYLKLVLLLTMKDLSIATLKLSMALTLAILLGFGSAMAQTDDRVLARVSGREIRQSEVDQLFISQVIPLEEQLYAIRKASLENLILSSILGAEAAKRGMTLEELRKTLSQGRVEVKLAEIESAYAENVSALGAMSPDEARERLRLDLETRLRMAKYRQAVTELRQSAVVEIYLDEPRWPWFAMADNSPVLGPEKGQVTIIEFADFQCPYCRESQSVIKQVLNAYPNDVKLVFKHLPLDNHPDSLATARASFCAGEQNLFWKYHDALFETRSFSKEGLQKLSNAIGLNQTRFSDCMEAERSLHAVAQDKNYAARWGINSTPTYIINGKTIKGAVDFETFKNLIESDIKSARTASRSH